MTRIRVNGRIDDNVVITGGAHPGGHVIQPQCIASPSGDDVIGARDVTAHADSAHDLAIGGVKR